MSKSIYGIFNGLFNLHTEKSLSPISLNIYRIMNKGYVLENMQGNKKRTNPLMRKLENLNPRGKSYKRMVKSGVIR